MKSNDRIYVAGHKGLVGSALVRKLRSEGYRNIIARTHKELDLLDAVQVRRFFEDERPQYVFLAAAHVGGINANEQYPADFYYINSMIQNNVIHNAYLFGVEKLLFLGSSCIYPRLCPQPIREEYLLTGSLEPTNEAYALAKISGLKMCQFYNRQFGTHFISCMPTNLYGPNDNFELETSHVLPAMIRKFHEAKINKSKQVLLWGTGRAMREFLHVDDMADACVFLMNQYMENEHINIGTGREISILKLAEMVAEVVGYRGEICFNSKKPDGTPRKLLNVDKLYSLGWNASIGLKQGITATYQWYCNHEESSN